MANDVETGNPIFIDTAGVTSTPSYSVRLHSIAVYPTAANWDILIGTDSTPTKVVFKAFGADKRSFWAEFPLNLVVQALYVNTLINCQAVIYLR